MNIQQLRYVVATAERGQHDRRGREPVRRPARAEPGGPLLERELDVTLFARVGRVLALTPAGEAFVGRARTVLRSLAALQQARDAGERESPFTIAASPTLQASMAIPILRALGDHGYASQAGCSAPGARPRSTSWCGPVGRTSASATRPWRPTWW